MRKRNLVTVLVVLAGALVATPGSAQALPSDSRVWFHPGGDRYTPSTIWRFDGTSSTGWKKSLLPTPTAWPVQTQYTFTYRVTGPTVTMRWTLSGGTGRVTSLNYQASRDILTVNYDGYVQSWYGCRSAGRPAYARAAC